MFTGKKLLGILSLILAERDGVLVGNLFKHILSKAVYLLLLLLLLLLMLLNQKHLLLWKTFIEMWLLLLLLLLLLKLLGMKRELGLISLAVVKVAVLIKGQVVD